MNGGHPVEKDGHFGAYLRRRRTFRVRASLVELAVRFSCCLACLVASRSSPIVLTSSVPSAPLTVKREDRRDPDIVPDRDPRGGALVKPLIGLKIELCRFLIAVSYGIRRRMTLTRSKP